MAKVHISSNNSAVLLLMTATVNNDEVAYFATKIVSVNMLPFVYFVMCLCTCCWLLLTVKPHRHGRHLEFPWKRILQQIKKKYRTVAPLKREWAALSLTSKVGQVPVISPIPSSLACGAVCTQSRAHLAPHLILLPGSSGSTQDTSITQVIQAWV